MASEGAIVAEGRSRRFVGCELALNARSAVDLGSQRLLEPISIRAKGPPEVNQRAGLYSHVRLDMAEARRSLKRVESC